MSIDAEAITDADALPRWSVADVHESFAARSLLWSPSCCWLGSPPTARQVSWAVSLMRSWTLRLVSPMASRSTRLAGIIAASAAPNATPRPATSIGCSRQKFSSAPSGRTASRAVRP